MYFKLPHSLGMYVGFTKKSFFFQLTVLFEFDAVLFLLAVLKVMSF